MIFGFIRLFYWWNIHYMHTWESQFVISAFTSVDFLLVILSVSSRADMGQRHLNSINDIWIYLAVLRMKHSPHARIGVAIYHISTIVDFLLVFFSVSSLFVIFKLISCSLIAANQKYQRPRYLIRCQLRILL